MPTFFRNISPYIEKELQLALTLRDQEQFNEEFLHLENAHVLGQESTYLHVKVHVLMLMWGIRNRKPKEVAGQLLRIVGAATKTAFGLVPTGNTGCSNISPFRSLPLCEEHQLIILQAKKKR